MEKRYGIAFVVFLILVTVLAAFLVFGRQKQTKYHFIKGYPLQISQILLSEEKFRLVVLTHPFQAGDMLALIDYNDNLIKWLPGGEYNPIKGDFPLHGYIFRGVGINLLDSNPPSTEVSVWFGSGGTSGAAPFYIFEVNKDGTTNLILKLFDNKSTTEITDLDVDGTNEVVHRYSLSGNGALERSILRWVDIYQIVDKKAIKVNDKFPSKYMELLSIYKEARKVPDAKFHLPVIDCLENQANLIIKGNFADSEICKEMYKNLPRAYDRVR